MSEEAGFHERVWTLAERAQRDEREFSPPEDPPDEEQAMTYLREGAGPAISLYVEARTGGRMVEFSPEAFDALEDAMNTWLELYAACYGEDVVADWTVREAAKLLIDTENVADVAAVLTRAPSDA